MVFLSRRPLRGSAVGTSRVSGRRGWIRNQAGRRGTWSGVPGATDGGFCGVTRSGSAPRPSASPSFLRTGRAFPTPKVNGGPEGTSGNRQDLSRRSSPPVRLSPPWQQHFSGDVVASQQQPSRWTNAVAGRTGPAARGARRRDPRSEQRIRLIRRRFYARRRRRSPSGPRLVISLSVNARTVRRALAVAAILAVVLAFALEDFPHRHAGGLDDRECPACQAARQHVGDAPRVSGVLLISPAAGRPLPATPAIERISSPPPVSNTSPRSPPAVSA